MPARVELPEKVRQALHQRPARDDPSSEQRRFAGDAEDHMVRCPCAERFSDPCRPLEVRDRRLLALVPQFWGEPHLKAQIERGTASHGEPVQVPAADADGVAVKFIVDGPQLTSDDLGIERRPPVDAENPSNVVADSPPRIDNRITTDTSVVIPSHREALELYELGRWMVEVAEEAMRRPDVPVTTPGARAIMSDVYDNPGSAIGDIAARTALPQSFVSDVVAAMREKGVFETFPDLADRRRTLVKVDDAIPNATVDNYGTASVDNRLLDAFGEVVDVPEFVETLEVVAAHLRVRRGVRWGREAAMSVNVKRSTSAHPQRPRRLGDADESTRPRSSDRGRDTRSSHCLVHHSPVSLAVERRLPFPRNHLP